MIARGVLGGWTLHGKVVATVAGGRAVWAEEVWVCC